VADLTYKQLQKTVAALARDVAQHAAAVGHDAKTVDHEAHDTARIADTIAGIGIDADTIAETQQLARITAGVSQAAIAYAAAGDTTGKAAQAAGAQATASHGGIHQAYTRSTVDISHMKPEWLRQE
jgi:hypothetical protein